ncbi:calcium-binding protein, partial [Brenneria alni]|uniref:calcium-binding protein n=1 Tax=Brenneria alni TaxID=71656 RepID=UPI0023E7E913
ASMQTAGDDRVIGSNVADTLRGGKGDDYLNGGEGSDSYHYAQGDGNDTIVESINSGRGDQLALEGIATGQVSLTRSGNDVTLHIAASAEGAADAGTILLKNQFDNYFNRGVETVVFDDGTAWSQADIRARLIAESQTAGDDRVIGSNVADTLRGGKGDDYLNGGEGSDSYHYAQGDGNDTIVESINSGRGDQLALEGIATGQVS